MAEGIGLLNQRIELLYHGFESHFLRGDVVQLAERMLCKHEVTGSSPVISRESRLRSSVGRAFPW